MADVEHRLNEIHPGDILFEEFMRPLSISAAELADSIGVAVTDVEALLDKRLPVSVALAERLASRFGSSQGFWMNLQREYDRRIARGPE